jgi:hypothetical protein
MQERGGPARANKSEEERMDEILRLEISEHGTRPVEDCSFSFGFDKISHILSNPNIVACS